MWHILDRLCHSLTLCSPKKALSVGKLSDLSTAGEPPACRPPSAAALLGSPAVCPCLRFHSLKDHCVCVTAAAAALPQLLPLPWTPGLLACRSGCCKDSRSGG